MASFLRVLLLIAAMAGVVAAARPMEPTVVATAPAAECGKQASYAECWPRSQCCNAAGMCGAGDAFCGNGCQGGSCYASPFNLN